MANLIILLVAAFVCVQAKIYEESYLENVPKINAMQKQWKAGYNRYFKGMDMEVIRKMMGTRLNKLQAPEMTYGKPMAGLPATFDARTQWPKCTSIAHIRDQGNCGSCWAVSAAEVATDRTCIQGNGASDAQLSAEDVMACCSACGYGCGGGYPISAMEYWQTSGVVTGGDFASNKGCLPYEVAPCGADGCSGPEAQTPPCVKKCENGYGKTFGDDEHHAASAYYLKTVADIQQDVYKYGPAEAAFNVYADFMNYKSGVYKHVSGEYLGGHAVKILGWGTLSGTPYWLVANSWNSTWGMDGYFMIERGVDECGFEDGVVAGVSKN